jgi:thioredoxin-dependent peroxiredoxin
MSVATKTTTSIQLGDVAPDFKAKTTEGDIQFHQWIGKSWCILFSHPKAFTPVCTTELGEASRLKKEFEKRNVKIISLSVDGLESHLGWINDINETQQTKVNFPMIADPEAKIAHLYGMIHPHTNETFTVRSVFIIDPDKKVRLMMTYPASTGRNFSEILRVVDSLQLTTYHSVATPANWRQGEDCIIAPSITDPKEMKKKFPKGWKELKPYLRITPQPDMPHK